MMMIKTKYKCDAYCEKTFKDVAYCLSNKQIYPSLCVSSCLVTEINIQFVCKINHPKDLRYCQARCQKNTPEENNQVFGNECGCPRIYGPVCGDNGTSFFNDCFRICAQVNKKKMDCAYCENEENKDECVSACQKGYQGYCNAPEFEFFDTSFAPVCGSDNNTYANDGLRSLAEVELAQEGACTENKHLASKSETF
jgi:hypothetical protein